MAIRQSRVHRETVHEAGYSTVSPLSVIAGVVCAYGAFAIVAAVVGSILTAIDVETEFQTNDWTSSGAAAALASAVVLFLAYLFGGYVAGRMARRSGVLHGLLVFIVSIVLAAVVGGVVGALADGDEVEQNLRSVGIPTTWDQVEDVALGGAILSVVAVLLGSLLGGALGERWHTKLARRVADPEIGPAADARRRADEEAADRHDRIDRDSALHRDLDHDGVDDDRDIDLRDDEPRYTAAEWREREGSLRQ